MEFLFRTIRRLLLIIEWLFTKILSKINSILPFWKVKPVATILNAINLPQETSDGTLRRGVWINGRVLSIRKTTAPRKDDSGWVNFKRMASQWFTREIPHTGITINIGTQDFQLQSDEEGYFELKAQNIEGDISIRLDDYPYEAEVKTTGSYHIPESVIISDVDDTLLETGAVSLGKMLKTTLLSNALTRELVPGMSELIADLYKEDANPVFYVTSSPWNLHSFLRRVFDRAKLPMGGIFMTDWGLTPGQWLTPSHYTHKGEALKKIEKWYPNSDIILFGDDSQKDHEIYATFIRRHPDKIKAAFIRHVATAEKRSEVQALLNELHQDIGKEVMYSVEETNEARAILTKNGCL